MGQSRHSTANYLSWFRQQERSVAVVLITGVGMLLTSAPVFAASA